MKKVWICLGSAIVGVLLSYLGNQLPGLPSDLKRWVIPGVVVLTLGSAALLVMAQGGDAPRTGMRGIKIKGKKNQLRAGANPMEDVQVEGDENDLDANASQSGASQSGASQLGGGSQP